MTDITQFLIESSNANRKQKGIEVVVRNIASEFRNKHNEKVKIDGNRISIDLKKYRDYDKSDKFILKRFEDIMKRMFSDYSEFIETNLDKNQLVINITAISESFNESAIKYDVKTEEKYRKDYDNFLIKLSKGGKITDKIRIEAATKVYDGKVFINTGGVEYTITVDKKAKNANTILTVVAKKGSQSETKKINPNNVPFMIG